MNNATELRLALSSGSDGSTRWSEPLSKEVFDEWIENGARGCIIFRGIEYAQRGVGGPFEDSDGNRFALSIPV